MLDNYNKETHIELSADRTNFLKEKKVYVLPTLNLDHAIVEIILTDIQCIVVESPYFPIRYGRHCGTRVHLISSGDFGYKIDYSPRFIWNGSEWFIDTKGTFLFAEVEFNT